MTATRASMDAVMKAARDFKAAQEAEEAREEAERAAFAAGCRKFAVSMALLPLRAWLLMLGVGALHGAFLALPTIGFGAALLVLLAVEAVARS
jgi:anti-sigma factor RsiW